jgi:hypothetical protein
MVLFALFAAIALLVSTVTGGVAAPITPPGAGVVAAAVSAADPAADTALDPAIAQMIAQLTEGRTAQPTTPTGTQATTQGAAQALQAATQAATEAAQAAGLEPLVSLVTTMTGAQEVPGPGDPDGRGTARILLLPDGRTLCYLLTATGIEPATAAHIHRGAPTEAGPVVVPLSPPTAGISGGCVAIDPALHAAIRTNPHAYYVNVHNMPYPDGAIRGQL